MTAELPAHARKLLRTYRDAGDLPADVEARIAAALFAAEPRRRRPLGVALAITVVAASLLLGIALRPIGDAWTRGRTERPDAASHELQRDPVGGAVLEPRGNAGHASPAGPSSGTDALGPAPSSAHAPEVQHATPPVSSATPRREPRSENGASRGSVSDHRPSEAARDTAISKDDLAETAEGTQGAQAAPRSGLHSRLAQEQRLVELAWSALATQDLERASLLTRSHAREFPKGALAPEREAIEALLSCAHAHTTTPTAASFIRRYPGSPLAARVEEACRER